MTAEELEEWVIPPRERTVTIGGMEVLLREIMDAGRLIGLMKLTQDREQIRHLFTLDGTPMPLAEGEARALTLLSEHTADPPLSYAEAVRLSRTWGRDCLRAAEAAAGLLDR